MKVSVARLLLVLTLLLVLATSSGAQWKNVAPNLIHQADQFGAMQFRDGIVWAGGDQSLWSSTDGGLTWTKNTAFPGAQIKDIVFYNKSIGLVATKGNMYLTTDGGKSWTSEFSDLELRKAGFGAASTIMYGLDYDGSFYRSFDGGKNWSASVIPIDARSFAVARDGTIYAQASTGSSGNPLGTVIVSNDNGTTWTSGGQSFQYDCYSLAVDSCDTKHLVLVNEHAFDLPTGTGVLLTSADGGLTWQQTDSHSFPYFSGAMTTNGDAAIVGTLGTDGELRSMDKGQTWNSIGGPALGSDTRNLAIINDNTILAADNSGSIWLTTNGGGDSVSYTGPFDGTVAFSTDSLFQGDTLRCDSATLPLYTVDSGCHPPLPQQYRITGPDAASFRVIDQADDSVAVQFVPGHSGAMNATLVVTLANGIDSSISLCGFSAPPEMLAFDASTLNVQTDTIGGDVSVPIKIDGLLRPEIVELVLHYPLADLVYDGSSDRSGMKVDIPGEAWPGRAKLRIVDDTPGTVAAYAHFNVFSDTNYHPQITFDSVDIPTALSSCSYSLPPAVTATIYPLEGCGDQLLSRWVHLGKVPLLRIQPNPSNGVITISSSQDLGTATIEAMDALGTLRARFQVSITNDAPAQLLLPFESGVYYIRVISGSNEESVPVVIAR